jgi:hypothetical protein
MRVVHWINNTFESPFRYFYDLTFNYAEFSI